MPPAPEGPATLAEDEVRSLARLANLDLPDAEIRRLTGDLGRILAYVRQLEELDVTGIEPGTYDVPVTAELPSGVTLVAASPETVSVTVSAAAAPASPAAP